MAPKKGKKAKAVDDDWEAELGEDLTAPPPPPAQVDDDKPAAKANGGHVKDDDDDDGGGLMSQLGKGKKGKKGKKNKKQEEDDWEAELGEDLTKPATPVAAAAAENDADDVLPSAKAGKKAAVAPPEIQSDEDDTPQPEVRIKTKAEKEKEKKEKEKAKKKAQAEKKKAAAKGQPIPTETKQQDPTRDVEHEPEAPAKSTTTTTGGAKPKVNARIAAIQKQQELRRLEEERIRQEQEAEDARIAAEEAAAAEEERKKEEAKQKKKERERQKIAEQKAAGTFMTKKQKEAAALAEKRKQDMLAAGMTVAGLEGGSPKPKRPVYDNKKKNKKGAQSQASPAASPNPQREPSPPVEALKKLKVEEPPVTIAQDEEEEQEGDAPLDSWEAALDESDDDEVKESWDQESEKAEEEAPEEEKSFVTGIATAKDLAEQQKKRAAAAAKEESDDDASGSDSDSDSGSDTDSDSDSDSSSAAGGRSKNKALAAKRKAEAQAAKTQRIADAKAARSQDDLRSPICCIMGHVDTGKTSLLDKVRQTNVQGGEAGGITQQIGATYFPMENIMKKTRVLEVAKSFEYKLPGLLVIDTPGHESFSNLRSRGSSLCNIAILVIDIMHGLEPQTIESIKMLKDKRTPFIVALNKIDRLYDWQPTQDNGFRESLAKQKRAVKSEFDDRLAKTKLALAEQGLNSELYYENKKMGRNISLVPTSAHTGEGIPDLLHLLVTLSQQRMTEQLMYVSELECTVLEVKVIEGLGTTIDVVVVNGVLREGDRIVVAGINGPIVTTIRAILTPQPLKELRVKGSYVHHKEVKAALGVKIAANDLEKAIAGSRMLRVEPGDDEEDLMDDVMEDIQEMLESIDKSQVGVHVQASTLGALEALLEFLKTSNIPVSSIEIGPVYRKHVMRSASMLEKAKEYAVMLCFDVEVDKDAQLLADQLGVTIFAADIIYHLFDAFTAHRAKALEQKRSEGAAVAVFPCVLKTIAVFNKRDPIILGIDVIEGSLRPGTPVCAVKLDAAANTRTVIELGKVASMEKEHKQVDIAKKGTSGQAIAVKLEGSEQLFGRHVDQQDLLYSHITRKSIDVLKGEAFRDGVTKEEWALIVKLKKTFGI